MNPEQRKPRNWCGTEPSGNINKENQAPYPETEAMAELEGKAHYPCVTQQGNTPTFGVDPSLKHNPKGDGMVVGVGPIIPRWVPGTKLRYFVVREGFPNDVDFNYSSQAFAEACKEWNDIKFGVYISPTNDRKVANFVVKYFKPPPPAPGEDPDDTIASAFFPNEVKDVRVYDFTLVTPKWRAILKNSFLHEIGHIIGLRHEHAIVGDARGNKPEKTQAHQFGDKNPISVMSYEDKNEIQDSDKKDVIAFYKLANRFLIDDTPITDFVAKPLP
jgi:hypothetical protein